MGPPGSGPAHPISPTRKERSPRAGTIQAEPSPGTHRCPPAATPPKARSAPRACWTAPASPGRPRANPCRTGARDNACRSAHAPSRLDEMVAAALRSGRPIVAGYSRRRLRKLSTSLWPLPRGQPLVPSTPAIPPPFLLVCSQGPKHSFLPPCSTLFTLFLLTYSPGSTFSSHHEVLTSPDLLGPSYPLLSSNPLLNPNSSSRLTSKSKRGISRAVDAEHIQIDIQFLPSCPQPTSLFPLLSQWPTPQFSPATNKGHASWTASFLSPPHPPSPALRSIPQRAITSPLAPASPSTGGGIHFLLH